VGIVKKHLSGISAGSQHGERRGPLERSFAIQPVERLNRFSSCLGAAPSRPRKGTLAHSKGWCALSITSSVSGLDGGPDRAIYRMGIFREVSRGWLFKFPIRVCRARSTASRRRHCGSFRQIVCSHRRCNSPLPTGADPRGSTL
jgi:hypothetical protein